MKKWFNFCCFFATVFGVVRANLGEEEEEEEGRLVLSPNGVGVAVDEEERIHPVGRIEDDATMIESDRLQTSVHGEGGAQNGSKNC